MVQRHRYQYGADPSQWGELFLPELPAGGKHEGVVVVVHGGYWRSRYGAELGEPLAKDLAEHGMAAWNLEYRRAGNGGGWPGTFQDVLGGIDRLAGLAEPHALDLGKVVALGHSAGGHLAATLSTAVGTGNPALDRAGAVPDLSVLCYPVASMTHETHQGSVENLLGAAPPSNLLSALSAELNVTDRTPPAFLWHTADDQAVPVSNSLNYAAALFAAGVPAELHVFPRGRHGLGLAADEPGPCQWTALCAAWLERAGWTNAPVEADAAS